MAGASSARALTQLIEPPSLSQPPLILLGMPSCGVEDCGRKAVTRGWCSTHYKRWRRHGDPNLGARQRVKACTVSGCPNPAEARRLCHGHYLRLLRKGEWPVDVLSTRERHECSVPSCDRLANAHDLCPTHYMRLTKRGDLRAEEPIRTVSGVGYLSHGYMVVPVPRELRHLTSGKTPVHEHRFVMAWHLGRPLREDEVVHHRNGMRNDNRIENLELWSVSQPKGQRVVDKVAFAVEILRRYRLDLLAPRTSISKRPTTR